MRLSMTQFADIVSVNGTPKVTKVKELKERDKYEPARDFYRPIREHIISIHKNNGSKKDLDRIMGQITDKKKLSSYPEIIQGYKKWWGSNAMNWIEPPRGSYMASGIEIAINPDIGFKSSNGLCFIKLYFNADPLSKTKASIITNLMGLFLKDARDKDSIMSILDIRNIKLFTYHSGYNMKPLIDAELAYIASLWAAL